ncbi:Protein of unknown function [Humidesulfovibrio mexicanus]|uniref:Uncharacterized protein n=1 Tax=Humidesulfovibrio mexicanus TaxID=147047 RepID=A0A239BS48_9BACT|nr:Protein of unknown function [Humidesulfovibrio mexicanus]
MRLPFGLGRTPKATGAGHGPDRSRGVMAFAHTAEVIRAEAALKAAGFAVRVMGPPPDMRTGCDMVVEFELVRELAARRSLEAEGLSPLAVAPVRAGMLEPVSLFQTVDFGPWLMVRAANMKITVDRRSRVIVNVSGGGCPDVPALAELMVGRTLDEAPPPREHGQTLCSYALELAFQEAVRLLPPEGEHP